MYPVELSTPSSQFVIFGLHRPRHTGANGHTEREIRQQILPSTVQSSRTGEPQSFTTPPILPQQHTSVTHACPQQSFPCSRLMMRGKRGTRDPMFSLTAFTLPGSVTTSVLFRVPATGRDKTARGVYFNPPWKMACTIPGASLYSRAKNICIERRRARNMTRISVGTHLDFLVPRRKEDTSYYTYLTRE